MVNSSDVSNPANINPDSILVAKKKDEWLKNISELNQIKNNINLFESMAHVRKEEKEKNDNKDFYNVLMTLYKEYRENARAAMNALLTHMIWAFSFIIIFIGIYIQFLISSSKKEYTNIDLFIWIALIISIIILGYIWLVLKPFLSRAYRVFLQPVRVCQKIEYILGINPMNILVTGYGFDITLDDNDWIDKIMEKPVLINFKKQSQNPIDQSSRKLYQDIYSLFWIFSFISIILFIISLRFLYRIYYG